MIKKLLFLNAFVSLLAFPNICCYGQSVGISGTGAVPDASAILDIDATGMSPKKGLLIPRMTTTERDAISGAVNSLLIFNTTTNCFEAFYQPSLNWVAFGCIGCTAPTAITAVPSPNPICEGSTLTLTGTATNALAWNWTGPNGFTSTLQSPTIAGITSAGAGVYTLAASNTCGSVNASTASITVSAAPTTANAGTDINPACGLSTATLAGNSPAVGAGTWSCISGCTGLSITTPNSNTSGVTGIAVPGTTTLRWTISNSPCTASTDDVVITTTSCVTCGSAVTVNHTIGVVAPETKTVNYGTVLTSLSGASKCWITQNLGSTNQASSASDATDAAAGWYWQVNLKQGYKVGPTPAWTVTAINDNNNWTAAQDPCTIELGTGWRIPTYTEWFNADANGPWTSYTDTYNSVLKIHAAGYLTDNNGTLTSRGTTGFFWSSTQASSTIGQQLNFNSTLSFMSTNGKALGYSIRCIKD